MMSRGFVLRVTNLREPLAWKAIVLFRDFARLVD